MMFGKKRLRRGMKLWLGAIMGMAVALLVSALLDVPWLVADYALFMLFVLMPALYIVEYSRRFGKPRGRSTMPEEL